MSSTTPRARRIERAAGIAAIAGLLLTGAGTATAAEIADETGGEPKAAASAQTPAQAPAAACQARRPVPGFNRWQENWGALADPCLPRKPLDALKYIPLSGDPSWYLSLGANLRERFEFNDAPLFGLGGGRADGYVIQRAQV
ncbi:alginate export family protein, partial [Burkholderia gladioli]|nr:alginate export family protein [Burkholderia gladioli]